MKESLPPITTPTNYTISLPPLYGVVGMEMGMREERGERGGGMDIRVD